LAEQSGGTCRIERRPGAGTSIEILLPRADPQAAATPAGSVTGVSLRSAVRRIGGADRRRTEPGAAAGGAAAGRAADGRGLAAAGTPCAGAVQGGVLRRLKWGEPDRSGLPRR
jgi:hypothetical protein